MNETTLLVTIFLGFIFVMTILLNYVEKERITLIGDFFKKVLPSIPMTKIFSIMRGKKEK